MALFLIKKEADSKKTVHKRIKVPTVLQMEAVECGAASLGMIMAHYGRFVPLEILRVECGVSRDGSKASNILKAARKYGLEAKGYRYEPADLLTKRFPLIIHWDFSHFLVLEGFKGQRAYLNDPSVGPRTVTMEEFNKSFTGITMTFEPTAEFVKGGDKPNIIKSLNTRFKNNKTPITFAVLAGLGLVVPGLIIPGFSRIYIDDILLKGKLDWIFALVLGMLVTALIRAGLTWLQRYYLLRLETKIALSTASQYFWHILNLPVVFFTQRSSGDISSRMMSNDRVAALLSGQLAKTFLNVIMIVFYLALMGYYDMTLTVVCLFSTLLNILFMQYISKKRTLLYMRMLQDVGRLQGTSMSGLQTIETLKATGSESDFFSKWSGCQAKIIACEQTLGVFTQKLISVPLFLTTLSNVIVLVMGAFRIVDGHMTIGTLVAYQSLMQSFLSPVNQLVDMASTLQEVQGDINRLEDVLKYPGEKQNASKADNQDLDEAEKLKGYVELRNITFGYSNLEPPLIADFSLKMKPGSRIAIIGGSGSGKSTIAKLLSGLYKPWSGEVLFDGINREALSREVLKNSFAAVDQEICLFADSIKQNVTMWNDTIPENELVRAAKDACIHSDITDRDGSYDSILREGGSNFSGGQRQRLEIARALVGNPSILVLDEATSALDTRTERIIDENIRRRGCTCIIIAHRLSTIRDCDEIIVMDKGKILQRGTHDEMKAVEGAYSRLINMQ